MDQQNLAQEEQNPVPASKSGAVMWIRAVLIIAVLPAVVLFGSAGTLQWPMAWLFILIMIVTFVTSRLIVWRRNPDLLTERGRMMDHEDTASFDRILAPLLALVGPLLIALVAGLAVLLGWAPVFDPGTQWLGLILLLLGNAFGTWALVENRFFSGVVRIQKERDHQVISSGPYALVRHPGYLGAGVSYLGMVLMLGSPWALLPYLLLMIVLVIRTVLEDKMLQTELAGYAHYAGRVRFRLLPGIW